MHEQPPTGFAHQRLDAYQVALDLLAETERLTTDLPRGFAELRDQARRAAMSTVRHIAEGAGRVTPADKCARFVIARGEVGELDATIETAVVLDLISLQEARAARALANRVGAMLTGLIKRLRGDAPGIP